jgi:hypothetical protein
MRWLSSGACQKSWESPCGARIALKVFPPSVDFWKETLLTQTVFESRVSAWIFV